MSKSERQSTTIKFDKSLHKKLAILAIEADSNMQDIVVEAVERLVNSVDGKNKEVLALADLLKNKKG